jgi:hypothetical protein
VKSEPQHHAAPSCPAFCEAPAPHVLPVQLGYC